MNPQKRKYYTVLVHYDDPSQTKQAVTSLRQCQSPPDGIVVVDHGVVPLQWNAPSPAIIRPSVNGGYAAGVNSGLGFLLSLGIAEEDIVIVMNSDVTVYPTTLSELRSWWHRNPDDALTGAVIEEPGGTVRGRAYINLINGRTELYEHGHTPKFASYRLSYIHGAFFSAPYRVLLKLKGLPEHYFLYWEDAALSMRAKKRRVPLTFSSAVRAKHNHHLTKQQKADQLYYLVRNGALFLEQETPPLWRYYWRGYNRLRLLYHALKRPQSATVLQALSDARHHVTGPNKTKQA